MAPTLLSLGTLRTPKVGRMSTDIIHDPYLLIFGSVDIFRPLLVVVRPKSSLTSMNLGRRGTKHFNPGPRRI